MDYARERSLIFSRLRSTTSQTERRCYIRLCLCKTDGEYLIPLVTSLNLIRKLKVHHPYLKKNQTLPHSHNKYQIFCSLLQYVKHRKGQMNHVVRYQLLSDCQTQEDLNDFIYHISKLPPLEMNVCYLLADYAVEFDDQYFEPFRSRLYFKNESVPRRLCSSSDKRFNEKEQRELTLNPFSSFNTQYDLMHVVGCNSKMNVFYTSNYRDKQWDNALPMKVANSIHRSNVTKELKAYIKGSFCVNSRKGKNLPDFILPPHCTPLKVQCYRNEIINLA